MAVELLRRHAGARQHALALHLGRRADHDGDVDPVVAAGLEQQRDLEHGHRGARGAASACRNARSAACTSGCTIASSRLKPAGSRSSAADSFWRSTRPSRGRAGKRCLDRRHRRARVELVHLGVGVAHRDAALAEARRDRRFAHADRAGQSDDQHPAGPFAPSSLTKGAARSQLGEQRQQRQAEDREIVALDALEQLQAETFELIGADAACTMRRRPRAR